ncbi:MAG TPA: FtsX-like permease family protein [Candidatus Acidoferrales bacterium]|nr:FtsX-like permease family protein [Candidatus Acidoferrales bacterium]
MFWRVLRRLFVASRGRLIIALVAVASGAAVTTALLNLQWDAERKLSAEFRTLGANVTILPRGATGQAAPADPLASPLENENVMARLAQATAANPVTAAPYLYVVAKVPQASHKEQDVIVAGTWLDESSRLTPWWKITGETIAARDDSAHCLIGSTAARQLGLSPGSPVTLQYAGRSATFTVGGVIHSGAEEDSQIFANLAAVQKLAGLEGRIGLVQLSVPGTPREIAAVVTRLTAALPDLEVRPVRQLAEAEGRLLGRMRGLIFAMVVLILGLTMLCVLASMAALAMERRRDVGLMKAIGGSMSRIVRIFLAEAGALGFVGGVAGYVLGIALSQWIGRRAFNVAIAVRPEVLPLVVALMVGVALAGALPLRLLGRVRPAEILRGE